MADEQDQSGWARRRATESKRIEFAAMQLCLERGVDEVTIEEVAAAAGISRRTFYRYFDTIDDVLCASPKRSIDRIARAVRDRPISETVGQAFVNAAREARPSEEERKLQTLGAGICVRYPVAWWRALGRIHPSAGEVFEELVAERLAAAGKDPSSAALISGVLQAVFTYTARKSQKNGRFDPKVEDMEAALKAIADVFGD